MLYFVYNTMSLSNATYMIINQHNFIKPLVLLTCAVLVLFNKHRFIIVFMTILAQLK